MTAINQPDGNSPDDLPLLTRLIGDETLNNLPLLTEVVAAAEAHRPSTLNEEEIQRILNRLETHLETMFTQKLHFYFEQLQRLAVEQAIVELKLELPEILREALNTPPESH